jgi:hypothetical protein
VRFNIVVDQMLEDVAVKVDNWRVLCARLRPGEEFGSNIPTLIAAVDFGASRTQ